MQLPTQPHFKLMSRKRSKTVDECDVLSHYLVNAPPTKRAKTAYYRALQNVSPAFSPEQQTLFEKCMKREWLLPYVDAYLGSREPHHPIRKKIFIMLAVLETQPGYSSHFLPSKSSFLKVLSVVVTRGIISILKLVIGRIVIWIA